MSNALVNPTFSDILNLLNRLVLPDDPNIGDAPHGRFWQNVTRDQFVKMDASQWGGTGLMVTPGNPSTSNIFLALSGANPFDGSELPQMPDTGSDPKASRATQDDLNMVATWIRNGAPA